MQPKYKKILFNVLFLVAIPIPFYLGFWQLDRSETKKEFIEQINDAGSQNITHINSDNIQSLKRGDPISCIADIDINKRILLDNQINNHQAGFLLLLPARCVDMTDTIVTVNLGWIPKEDKEQQVIVDNPVKVNGIIYTPASGILLKEQVLPAHISWPLIIQKFDNKLLSEALNSKVSDKVIQLPSSHPLAKIIEPISVRITPAMHKGYAVQWFTLGIVLVVYYCIVRRRLYNAKPSRKQP